MKKICYLLVALSVGMPVGAKTISPSQAVGIASDFMAGKSIDRPLPVRVGTASHSAQETSPYYIYNYDGGGFVIISGDDRFGEILAYDTAGTIDMAAAPDALVNLLHLYTVAYESLPADDTTCGSQLHAVPAVVVEPLLGEITWGQDTPFNTMTPVATGGNHYYTGCVACAGT